MTAVKLCGVADPAAIRAIAATASFWDVSITVDIDGNAQGFDGAIFGDGFWQQHVPRLLKGEPFMGFVSGRLNGTADPGNELTFARIPEIPETLRGKTLFSIEPTFSTELEGVEGMTDAARVAGKVIWKCSQNGRGSSFAVATPPPLLNEGCRLPQIFNGETFLHLLPIWLFLRGLVEQTRWRPAPLRACMVVDDPNLHRSRYGYLNYAKVLNLARSQPFHLAIAMVPLDGWSVRSVVAKMFRDNPNSLSILVHGNNHLAEELALPLAEEGRRELVSQSISRTKITEQKWSLAVDRVMAPPHGVCSREMMDSLWCAGFEGLNSNRWSLWKHSPPDTLPEDAFLRPAAVLTEGLPVVTRFRFRSSIYKNEIHLAAILGQPIVPYGHHQDFSGNMADVIATSDEINSLGVVKWMSMRKILESNYEHRISGNTFEIRLYSRRVNGTMPDGTTELLVSLPDNVSCGARELRVDWNSGTTVNFSLGKLGHPIPVQAGCHFEVCFARDLHHPELTNKSSRVRPKVLLRRLFSELRDRLSPLAQRLRGRA